MHYNKDSADCKSERRGQNQENEKSPTTRLKISLPKNFKDEKRKGHSKDPWAVESMLHGSIHTEKNI